MSSTETDVFREQTRTIVRAAIHGSFSNMEVNATVSFVAKCVDDLGARNYEEFEQMCRQLDANPTNVQPRVVKIFNETFDDGITWGRVVAFLAFMKHFAADCEQNKRLCGSVKSICEWSGDLISTRLEHWISKEGGWGAIEEAIDVRPKQRQQQSFDTSAWLMRGLAAAFRAVARVY